MALTHIATSRLPTRWAEFTIDVYQDGATGGEHVALSLGELCGPEPVLTRLHSECLTGDSLFSLRCDCGFQLEAAFQAIAENGSGLLLYLRQEGRGIGLGNKIRAYALQDQGADTVEANEQLGFAADLRSYEAAVAMLAHLGVGSVQLMTNNPRKEEGLRQGGIEVVQRIPIVRGHNAHNASYLSTKASRMGHTFGFESDTGKSGKSGE
jgi:GTP cyclohydrolase II